jgi:hypothetical protein
MVDAMRPEDDVVAVHGVLEVEPVWPQDEVATHGVVDDEPCDGPRDVPKHPDARRRRSSRRRLVSVRNVVPTLTSNECQGLSLNGRC